MVRYRVKSHLSVFLRLFSPALRRNTSGEHTIRLRNSSGANDSPFISVAGSPGVERFSLLAFPLPKIGGLLLNANMAWKRLFWKAL